MSDGDSKRSADAGGNHDRCPVCGAVSCGPNGLALKALQRGPVCQGYRAAATLLRRPGLLPLFSGYWERHAHPQCATWLARLPAPGDEEQRRVEPLLDLEITAYKETTAGVRQGDLPPEDR